MENQAGLSLFLCEVWRITTNDGTRPFQIHL